MYPTSQGPMTTCKVCGDLGILDVLYDYEKVKSVMTKTYLKECLDQSIWRYAPLLPVEGDVLSQTLKVGGTPLYKSKNLVEAINVAALYIKDDGLNPTASLKDRASVIAVVRAIEEGKDTIACSSTGNAASSLAGNAARLGLKTVIFVPKRAPKGKLTQLMIYGSKVISVDGDYRDTFNLSKAAIDHYGWYNRNAAINPYMVEGKKTVALEIAEQLEFEIPDWVVVSVGDGCTIAGVYKGFLELKRIGLTHSIPKLLGVQAEGCAPFYKAFITKKPLEATEENTLADSIAVGLPRNPIKGMNAVVLSQGTFITVTDQEILEAMALLGRKEGIFGEPAGVTGVAGLKKACGEGTIEAHHKVVVIMTGNGLKDIEHGIEAVGEPIRLKPDIQSFISHMKEAEETSHE
jgi:threonine synthase